MSLPVLVFATSNPYKLKEVRSMLTGQYEVKGLADIGCTEEIPETQDTLEGNARQKAQYVKDNYGLDCFSEDSGLEVDALGGAPGVHTAYYGSPDRDAQMNMQRVLEELAPNADRTARFRACISLIMDGQEQLFEGKVEGQIALTQRGDGGFGYDPIFIPDGYEQTFAELPANVKNSFSHRARATAKLKAYLLKETPTNTV